MTARQNRAIARGRITLGLTTFVVGVAATIVSAARADSTPVGPLPAGAVSTITTRPNQLVAVALPHASKNSGLVWRLARPYDSRVVREVAEADVGPEVVLVFKVVGRGKTSLQFALTPGDASPKATKSATFAIRSA